VKEFYHHFTSSPIHLFILPYAPTDESGKLMSERNWADILDRGDVESLWNELYQLISRHPGVRPLHFATDGAAVSSPMEINADLTQELFLELFQKQRFDHYLREGYTSAEIENEIAYIEIPNLVGARLRKRYPESFRMARRVSALLKSSSRFRRFTSSGTAVQDEEAARPRRGRPPKAKAAQAESDDLEIIDDFDEESAATNGATKRQRMVDQIFGLKDWPRRKVLRDSGHFVEMVKSVPMRRRDTRMVGRTGSSQLILSNPDLEELIVEVLCAIDSPADVRTIRQLTLSKIPLQDYNVASLDEPVSDKEGETIKREAADTRDTPEGELLRGEQDEQVARMAEDFIYSLRRAVNNNERRFARLIETMWYCYFDSAEPSQLEIARVLGVSDSLVSDNRRLIEHELKKLNLSIEDGQTFSESLKRLVAAMR
jgi:hypothetical protein